MAQQVEHVLGKDEVPGSNPGISSRKAQLREGLCFCFIMELWDEPVTEVRTRFCVSKTDEARRVKKTAQRRCFQLKREAICDCARDARFESRYQLQESTTQTRVVLLLYNENPAIVAGFREG